MKPPPGLKARLVAGSQSISTRRLLIFLSGILLLSVSALLFIPSSLLNTGEQSVVKFDLPHIADSITELNPFKPASHKPPPPISNSTASSDSWFSSWKWLNPFSSNVTPGDEERSVLPPMLKRCPVYTFYDSDAVGEDAKVEDHLLLAWRRAFWAQGFKPVILGMGEAKEHGLYRVVRDTGNFNPDFEREIMRWLAWSQMATTGILVDYRVIPMASWKDHTLTALRRCDFTYATRYENWGHRVFSGDRASIDAILKHITSNKMENDTVTIESATKGTGDKLFHIDPLPNSFADYTSEAIKLKYPRLKFSDLPALINAHLHENWQSNYPNGISLLVPFPENLGALHYPSQVLANRLASCPVENPEPLSCPSNKQECKPCKKALTITDSKILTNKTGFFSLGTIPHPYTFTALRSTDINLSTDSEEKSIRFVRRRTTRDEWLRSITTDAHPVGPAPRVLTLKQTIADPTSSAILSTSDGGFPEIEWTLGFTLPTEEQIKLDLPKPDVHQKTLLETTHKDAFSVRDGGKKKRLRKVFEAWNLGATEVWKFAGAFMDRMGMERRKWSDEEKPYGRGLSKEER